MVGGTPKVTASQALAVARFWDPAVQEAVHIRDGENSVWSVRARGLDAILRLTAETHRERGQIEAELDFLEHLVRGGLNVARALPDMKGERILPVPEAYSDRPTQAVMFERLAGRHFEYHSTDIDQPLFRQWGETMARLHDLSSRFNAPEGRQRVAWWDDQVAGCSLDGTPPDAAIASHRNELVSWISGLQPDPEHYGTVHGDFERTNFLLCGDTIGLFDFDDSCLHWFAWDIACSLWVFRNDSPENRSRFLGWFLDGYSSIREPDLERLRCFSEWVRLRCVALLLHRLRNQDDPSAAQNHSWSKQTREWLLSPWHW